jgi:hypothetical protein
LKVISSSPILLLPILLLLLLLLLLLRLLLLLFRLLLLLLRFLLLLLCFSVCRSRVYRHCFFYKRFFQSLLPNLNLP